MNDAKFDELAGRIEGIGRAFMLLVAMLEDEDMVNGRRYCAALRRSEKGLRFPQPHLAATKRTLRETAKALDDARKVRRTKERQA